MQGGVSERRGSACHFKSRWHGTWFQKGAQPAVVIDRSQFASKGNCIDADGDMFLLEDSRERCFRCVVIYEKHINVLQYRETFCDEYGTLEEACRRLNVDAHLHSLFRVDAAPVACPFRGPFSFSYNRGHGECKHPVSTVDSCTIDSHILFRFQACADVYGTESSVEELTCLAVWKEGSAYYLVGKMVQRSAHALPYSDGDSYRCFVYEHVGHQSRVFKVSQSPDATCDGLVSASEGSRTMTLTRAHHPDAGCRFPSWAASRRWRSLDGRRSFAFGQKQKAFRVQRAHSEQAEVRVTCIEDRPPATPNATTVLGYSTSGCNNGYVCVTFHRRDDHILEMQMGELTRSAREACLPPAYEPNTQDFITLVESSGTLRPCPALVSTDGLRVSGRAAWRPDGPCRDLAVGCRSRHQLEFLANCPASSSDEDRLATFQCHGSWAENGKNYLIAGLKGSRAKYCFVFWEGEKVTQLSGLHDTCRRSALPGLTGNLTFNISAAGDCDFQLSQATTFAPAALLLPSGLQLILMGLLLR
ncbi:uncharacterized protein LOC135391321 isoform X2 [Ornithodoros turicata]|uniref:uncharacterized protein LOC135391321 isoform X2 n=1 Tax=Ornithodoros turicata TaxID=34597 RepID=UPI0031386535